MTFLSHLMVVLLLLVTACDKGGDDKPGNSDEPSGDGPSASETNAAPSSADAKWKAKTDGGDEVVTIKSDGGKIKIAFGGKEIVGKNKSGKRKYEQDGAVIAVVKSDGAKLKIKDEGGKLLWKIKLKDDKVKIADNEELVNAYSIKTRDDGFKVKLGETELGKVKFYPDDKRIKVKDAGGNAVFKASADKASAMWGVLLLKDIPEAQRFVIMAELGARGR